MNPIAASKSRGPVRSGLAALAAITLITACSACTFILARRTRPDWAEIPYAVVRRASFDVCITASGVAQSSQQTVVKCQLENLRVRSRGGAFFTGGASTILEIVPNGVNVKKGDVLCRLDASEYEDVAQAQELRVLQHHAEMVQTALSLQSAEVALKEYRDGLLPHDIVALKGRIALAESELKGAEDRLAWSERMSAKGYASLRQVANDRAALVSMTLRLKQAQTELEIYSRFNSLKSLVSLQAEVEKARKWAIHEAGDFDKAKVQLAYYRRLIDRCTIRAPHDGFVIYANGPFRDEVERLSIEMGASVRQGQELFYFPDLSKMEVVAMLHEIEVVRISRGMPTGVRFEGSPGDKAIEGHVESVESLPRRGFNEIPYYPCRVSLELLPRGLLPGKSAAVKIVVRRCRDVLAIPSEAVHADHDGNICYVVGQSGLERRVITSGGSTPELIEVTDGLKEGEHVVLNPTLTFDRSAERAAPASADESQTPSLAAIR
jgi:HlyD family secretion protein